eukprot:scaffold803_cov310-Pinguiococcus_pyrenoidosus.AAC.176
MMPAASVLSTRIANTRGFHRGLNQVARLKRWSKFVTLLECFGELAGCSAERLRTTWGPRSLRGRERLGGRFVHRSDVFKDGWSSPGEKQAVNMPTRERRDMKGCTSEDLGNQGEGGRAWMRGYTTNRSFDLIASRHATSPPGRLVRTVQAGVAHHRTIDVEAAETFLGPSKPLKPVRPVPQPTASVPSHRIHPPSIRSATASILRLLQTTSRLSHVGPQTVHLCARGVSSSEASPGLSCAGISSRKLPSNDRPE